MWAYSKVFFGNPIIPFVSTQSSIQVGVSSGTVWVRVEGKGSFQNSTPLKEFAREMLSRGHRDFFVDLRKCPLMDSTFMGTLAGIALKIRAEGSGELHVVNLNERNHGLLCNLGLNQLLKVDDSMSAAEPALLQPCTLAASSCDKLAEAQTMLEAHEAVVAVDPSNEAKFKDVLEFLRQDIEARR